MSDEVMLPVSGILELAKQAGETLLAMRDNITVKQKPDGSKVTNVDIACNDMLVSGLKELTPNIAVLAEENSQEENEEIMESCGTFWTVDPLDVTSNYIEGRPDYSVNIALIDGGVPVQGALLFPAHGDVFFTGDDGHAYRREGDGPVRKLQVLSADAVRGQEVSLKNPFAIAVRQREEHNVTDFKQPFIQTVISAGQRRACMVAAGEVLMASEAAGFMIWDTAPAFAIIRAAGGDMRTENGQQLSFTKMQLPAYTAAHPSLLDKVYPVVDG